MKSGTVTIVGRPNSGKSTLLNTLVGQKVSIISDKPQTTRHRILGIFNDARGQIVFGDTPGIHKPQYRMNQRMQKTVIGALSEFDLVLHVVDASISFGAGERYVLEMIRQSSPRAVLAINKIDKTAKPKILPIIERYSTACAYLELIPLSAMTGEGIDLLLAKLFDYLPEGEPLYGEDRITDRNERFMAAEFIREKILERARQELPYTTAVLIRKFDESRRETKRLLVVAAEILVEKSSQQGIIVGAGGMQLKDIGSAARADLEELFDCRIYLDLHVRTIARWRDNDAVLDDLEVGT